MLPVRSVAMLQVRQRADMVNSPFVDDTELTNLMNDNLEIAYHHCVAAFGDTTFAAEFWISGLGPNVGPPTTWPVLTTGSVVEKTRYALPTNFGRLLRCEYTDGIFTPVTVGTPSATGIYYEVPAPNIRWVPMHPFDIAGSVYDSTARAWSETEVAYWITSHPGPVLPLELNPPDAYTKFWIAFLPVPSSLVSVHIVFVPEPPIWGTDDTNIIRLPDLAWKFVREATAADLLEKQRSDASQLRANAAAYLADIQNSKLGPDFANATGTVDIYGGSGVPPYGRRRQVWG